MTPTGHGAAGARSGAPVEFADHEAARTASARGEVRLATAHLLEALAQLATDSPAHPDLRLQIAESYLLLDREADAQHHLDLAVEEATTADQRNEVRQRAAGLRAPVALPLTELRTAFASAISVPERFRLLCALIAALPLDERAELGARLRDLDALLVAVPDLELPRWRVRLAEGWLRGARRAPSWLEEAWRHLEQARAQDLRGRTGWHEVAACVRLAQLEAGASGDGRRQVDLAGWFLDPSLPPLGDAGAARAQAARWLLHVGPFVHPDALALAGRLLRAAGDAPLVVPLSQRLAWIKVRIGAVHKKRDRNKLKEQKTSAEFAGPFDTAPAWLIGLAQGLTTRGWATPDLSDPGVILGLLEARPDRADEVLRLLVQLVAAAEVPAEAVSMLSSRNRFGLVGQRLLDAIDAAVARRPTRELLHLRATLYLESSAWGAPAFREAADALAASSTTLAEQVQAGLIKGIERMRASRVGRLLPRSGPPKDEDEGALLEARQVLDEAVERSRSTLVPRSTRFQVLVSSGNAWRQPPDEDLALALARYDEAGRIGGETGEERARLWKVTADALVQREEPGDVARALELVERSLAIRKAGYTRSETLLTAAEVEEHLPDRPLEVSLARSAARLEEALRHDDGRNRLAITDQLIRTLGRLVLLQPGERRWRQRLDAIATATPELRVAAERAREGTGRLMTRELVEGLMPLFTDPELEPMVGALHHLEHLDVDELAEFPEGLGEASAAEREQLTKIVAESHRTPDQLREIAAGLALELDPVRRPGALVGRARLLAHLAEQKAGDVRAAYDAAEDAEAQVRGLPHGPVRRIMMSELAKVWQPRDHGGHPMRDFRRSAEMLREVVDGCGPGEVHLRCEAMSNLARATRYRRDGDRRTFITEAVGLYEEAARGYDRLGLPSGAAHARMNASEARSALLTGGEQESLGAAVTAARTFMEQHRNPVERAHGAATLAMNLACLQDRVAWTEKEAILQDAVSLYDAVDWSLIPVSARPSHDNYRTIARADLAWVRGDHAQAVAIWRARMDALPRDSHPVEWAITAHNLGSMLTQGGSLPLAWEGLGWLHKALQVRTLPDHALHRWETSQNIGRTIENIFESYPEDGPWLLPIDPEELWKRGKWAFEQALEAAARAGGPERTVLSAQHLMRFSTFAPTFAEAEASAERAWAAMDEAMPLLLRDPQATRAEAGLCANVAGSLALALAEDGPIGQGKGLAFCLAGKRARRVLSWVARAAGAAQRRMTARLTRPEGVPVDLWGRWRRALAADDRAALERAVPELRSLAPGGLSGQPDLTATESWVEAAQGRALVAILETPMGLLGVVWEHGRGPRVALLAVEESCPVEPDAVERELTADGEPTSYTSFLAWTLRQIVGPLRKLLHDPLDQLVWIAPGSLRLLAPADLWPGVAVSCSTRLDLGATRPTPRPRRAFIAVADPGERSNDPAPLPGAVQAGARLARALPPDRALRVRLGSGPQTGAACRTPCPGLVEGAPSPTAVLRELADVYVAVFLCHGEVDSADDARLMLLGDDGRTTALEIDDLASDPHRLVGLTVILLACEAGRVGGLTHRAGGLAGVFLCAGAREVVAPLWPVRLEPAVAVGEAVLRAFDAGQDLASTLRGLHSAEEQGPLLGERRSRAERAAEHRWSLRAFVRWVG